jgi:hypothetical protein
MQGEDAWLVDWLFLCSLTHSFIHSLAGKHFARVECHAMTALLLCVLVFKICQECAVQCVLDHKDLSHALKLNNKVFLYGAL